MELASVRIEVPEASNIIIGQSHFIKTVEDLYEVMVGSVPNAKFGVAFSEASGPCLIRYDGNDDELTKTAVGIMESIGAGHAFAIVMRGCFPVNVMGAVKACPEVCGVYCATANPVEVIVVESPQGRGIMGVIDGSSPAGVEGEEDRKTRVEFLKKIGYKR